MSWLDAPSSAAPASRRTYGSRRSSHITPALSTLREARRARLLDLAHRPRLRARARACGGAAALTPISVAARAQVPISKLAHDVTDKENVGNAAVPAPLAALKTSESPTFGGLPRAARRRGGARGVSPLRDHSLSSSLESGVGLSLIHI